MLIFIIFKIGFVKKVNMNVFLILRVILSIKVDEIVGRKCFCFFEILIGWGLEVWLFDM